VKLVDSMGDDLSVVNAARVSFAGHVEEFREKDKKLIKYLADNNHMSPFEHCVATIYIKCPLYIRSQIMRHRTFSYNEVSRRYTSKNLEFHLPDALRRQGKTNLQGSAGELDASLQARYITDMQLMQATCLDLYEEMIALGVCREQARGILPQNLLTEFYMTGNLRNWVHFLKLRCDPHAQYEVQQLAYRIKDDLAKIFPISMKALWNEKTIDKKDDEA